MSYFAQIENDPPSGTIVQVEDVRVALVLQEEWLVERPHLALSPGPYTQGDEFIEIRIVKRIGNG